MRLCGCRTILLATGIFVGLWPACARGQNRFDVLAKTLQPYTALFFNKSTNRGVEGDITLRQDSSNNRLLLNRSTHVFFQPPDKLRIEVSGFDPKVVFCRNGQNIWVSPKSFGQALLAGLPASSSSKSVPEFRLPLKETEIMLLPALLQIYEFTSDVDQQNDPVWVLRLRPDPQLVKGKLATEWNASLTTRQKDNALEHLELSSSLWSGAIDVANTQFVSSFPDSTWAADPSQQADSVQIPASTYAAALERFAGLHLTR
jgi:hypothetical protein